MTICYLGLNQKACIQEQLLPRRIQLHHPLRNLLIKLLPPLIPTVATLLVPPPVPLNHSGRFLSDLVEQVEVEFCLALLFARSEFGVFCRRLLRS
jgi:hypothetical protein